MKKLRNVKPTPSMVVAAIALLVALSGTGIAAVAVAIPRGSVGTAQLKNDAVVSSKVKNGSLLSTDFKAGQIPAGPAGAAGPTGPAGAAGAAGATGPAGVAAPGYVAQVVSTTSTAASSTTGQTFSDVGSVNVTVPSGETDLLVVFFSAQSTCYGGANLRNCRVTILVDGSEIAPAAGDQIFDSNAARSTSTIIKNKDSSQSNSIIRVSGNLTAGLHTVKIQYSSTAAETTFELRNWSLVVQRVKVS